MSDENNNTSCSIPGFGCLGLIVTIFILFNLGKIWELLNKLIDYLLAL